MKIELAVVVRSLSEASKFIRTGFLTRKIENVPPSFEKNFVLKHYICINVQNTIRR